MHARRGDDDGVSLVEMMVAMLILGIAVAGLAATLLSSLNLTRQNHNRVIAANLAASEIESVLTLEFGLPEDPPDPATGLLALEGVEEWDVQVDGRPFTITRNVYWSANDAALGPCASDDPGAADENILRIDMSVTWPRPGNIPPVRSSTSVAPPVDVFATQGGIIAVYVLDHDAEPRDGVQVNLMGPIETTAATITGMTNEAGCAIFSSLGIGTYKAVLYDDANHPGFGGLTPLIDIDQHVTESMPNSLSEVEPTDVQDIQGVSARSRAMLEFFYTEGNALTVTADGWDGGTVPDFDFGPWMYASSRPSSPYEGPAFGETQLVYPAMYSLYSSFCEVADPQSMMPDPDDDDSMVPRWPGATRDSVVATESGGSSSSVVTLGTFTVDWDVVNPLGLTLPDAVLYAQSTDEEDGDPLCPQVAIPLDEVEVGEEDLRFALPWGEWEVWAEVTGVGLTDREPLLLDPADVGGTPPEVVLSVMLL